MMKLSYISFLIFGVIFSDSAIISAPKVQHFHEEIKSYSIDLTEKWGQHIMDILNLIDINQVSMVLMEHMQDPEVQQFIKFITSPKMTEIIGEVESIEEFMEAITFLESKGYDARYVVDVVNSFLKLPVLEEPKAQLKKQKGMVGFIDNMMAVLPVAEMQKLFESKLKNNPEVAELFGTFASEQFADIMERMVKNPKYAKLFQKIELNGFDSKFYCAIAQAIFGDSYQGTLCE